MALQTKDLKKMSIEELTSIADQLGHRLMFMAHSGLQEKDEYKRCAGELYHVADIIDLKEQEDE